MVLVSIQESRSVPVTPSYVISPRIMGRAVSVPGAVVVIAALAGGALLGLLGALVAIPVAASILIIYRQVVIPQQNER